MSEKPLDYWEFFAADARRSSSPLYARLAEGAAKDEDLKALAARARPGQPMANLLFASVHFLLIRGAQHPVRRFYHDLGGTASATGEDPIPPFKDFVGQRRDEIGALIATRITNTNEIGRSAILHGGFRVLAATAGSPLHLVEIGPSAGLNMIWDRYGVRYKKDGAVVASIAPDARLVLDCELQGEKIPPTGPSPKIASRVGLELNPVDLSNADDRDWLRALMWPDQPERIPRLNAAMRLFAERPPLIRAGDALDLLPDALAQIPPDGVVCVYHTIAIYQLSSAMREALEDMLTVAGLRRPLWRLAFEFDGKDCALSLIQYRDGLREEQLLARAHPHGTWLEWLA